MKKPLLSFLTSIICLYGFSQTITGKVVDSETKLPLEGASVYAQNTTKGTITDKEGYYSLNLGKGGFEIVFTFTGYENKTANLDMAGDRELNLEMQKADNSMSEVVVKNSNEVENGWEKHGEFFLELFIGATPFADSCFLENPQALKFLYYKRNDRLKVIATEPLIIHNKALGYNLRYQLDSFVYFNKSQLSSYRGSCFYSEMDGSEAEKQEWKENRAKAYAGSRLHFIRSYYDSTLKKEGFTVDILSTTIANKFNRLTNPYDTTYYFFDDSTANAELWFPAKVSITWHKKAPEKEYLEYYKLPADVRTQISYVDLLDAIVINPNGFFFEQKSWVNQGYWSWKNLADQLPYDYED
jgi:hypothetical protein